MNSKKYVVTQFCFWFLLIIFVLNIYQPHKLCSQTFPVDHYTETDGIINSTVYRAAQDSIGQMWFATRGGVSVYDGTYWKNYTVSDGLPSQNISKIFIDSKNRIWALQERHPIRICQLVNEHWEVKYEFKKLGIYSLYHSFIVDYDENGQIRIFVGTDNDGLIALVDNQWKTFNEESGLMTNAVNGLAFYHDSLFIATPKGLSVFSSGKVTNGMEDVYELPDKQITGIYIDEEKDQFIVSGTNWFGKVVNNRFFPVHESIAFTFNPINPSLQILPYKNIGYYFGTEYAVYFYDLKTGEFQSISAENGLITDGSTHLFLDRENVLWICSYRGVNKISNRLFVNYRKNSGLYETEVTAMAEVEKGKYILGYNGAVDFYENNKFNHLEFFGENQISKLHSRVQDIAIDEDKNIYLAASWQGLIKISSRTQKILRRVRLKSGANVNSVLVTDNGEVLFAAENQLYTLSDHQVTLWKPGLKLHTSIRKIHKDRQGNIFLSSMHEGLFYESNEGWKNIKGNPAECSNNVYAFLHDSRNRMFAGLIDGLYIIKNDSLVRFNPGGNIISNPIYSIFEDQKKRLWFGSDNGTYLWDGKKLLHFNINDGLAGQEVNRAACLSDSFGRIWIGTNNGLSLFREEFAHDTAEIPPPVVKLTTARSDYDTIALNRKNILHYQQNTLNFNFKAISFIDEKDIQVKFKMEGMEENYSEAFPTWYKTIRYNNLEPGKYRLCIKAKNAIGIWSDEVCSAQIIIRPPFYKTWWFLVLLIMLVALVVFWVLRYISQKQYAMSLSRQVIIRTRQLKESQRELQQLNKSREKLFSIIAHDLRSPFNSILGLTEILSKKTSNVSEKQKEAMIKSLYKTANQTYFLLENLLNWVRTERGDLRYYPQAVNLHALVEDVKNLMLAMANSKNVLLINQIKEDTFVFADINMLRTIIRNLLSNAIKFAPEYRKIEVFNMNENGWETICVKDNGKGMSDEQTNALFSANPGMMDKNSETGTGLGLVLCKEFVEKHGGEIKVSSKLNEGSTFCFTLPASKKA